VINLQIFCILLLFELGAANKPIYDVHGNMQSIYSCDFGSTLDNHGIILCDKARFFDYKNIPITIKNATHEDNSASANRITYGKVMFEAAGAAGCSFLLGLITYQVTDDWISAYCVAAPIGPAVGATLVGNSVMEPNGSFGRSVIGSITGAVIGGAIFYGVSWVIGVSHDINSGDKYWIGIVPAVSFPIIGAVAGYNAGYAGVHANSIQFDARSDCTNAFDKPNKVSARIQLISLRL